MENKIAVFVYGSLRRHLYNHFVLENSKLVAAQCWTYGKLYDTGWGFPAMVLDEDERVYGELYLVTEEVLQRLDQLEGYRGIGCENHYERVQKQVFTDSGLVEAQMYVYLPDQVRGMERIQHGDWMDHLQ